MENTLLLLLVCLVSFLVYTAVYAAKRRWFPAEVALKESVWVMLGLLPLLLAGLAALYWKGGFSLEGAAAALLIFLLGGLCFTLTVPGGFDRSLSVYMLNVLENRADQGMTEEEVKAAFLEVYLEGNYAIRKRLREQLVSGYVERRREHYYITGNGRRFVRLARMDKAVGKICLVRLPQALLFPHRRHVRQASRTRAWPADFVDIIESVSVQEVFALAQVAAVRMEVRFAKHARAIPSPTDGLHPRRAVGRQDVVLIVPHARVVRIMPGGQAQARWNAHRGIGHAI